MSAVAFGSPLRSHFFKRLSSRFSVFRGRIRRHSFAPPAQFSLLSPQFTKSPSSAQWSWRFNNNRVGVVVGVSSSTFSTQLHTPAPPTTSPSSPYLSVRIFCPKDVADSLSEALLCFGASSTSIDEQEANHEADHHEVCMNSIFSIHQDVSDCISQATDSIGLKEMPSYEVEMHDHTDWIQETQDSFHPVAITEGLWIVPEWRTPPDPRATNIVLNPGLAFGTGEHPTTKLCLVLLHGLIKGGEHFLDYGTGSGILAIAAIKFGATLSVAVDIDPQAITSAQHNAALNNIGPEKLQLLLVSGNGCPVLTDENPSEKGQNPRNKENVTTDMEKYDIVIANILLNPLLDLADQIISYAKPGAVVGVSGILSEQVPCIMERYSQFLEGITVSKMDDWACVCGSKKMILMGD